MQRAAREVLVHQEAGARGCWRQPCAARGVGPQKRGANPNAMWPSRGIRAPDSTSRREPARPARVARSATCPHLAGDRDETWIELWRLRQKQKQRKAEPDRARRLFVPDAARRKRASAISREREPR